MIFSEGGQPVYLDDLRIIQDKPAHQLQVLISTLGAGRSVFLLSPMKTEVVKTNSDGTTTLRTVKNWLVMEGEILELESATFTVDALATPLYAGVKKTKEDIRTFEDGQDKACVETTKAYLSVENTANMYNVYELKSLFELMAQLVKEKEPVNQYKDLQVEFHNGYTGIAQYKEEIDRYRIRIKARSSAGNWEASGLIFSLRDDTFSFLDSCVSADFLTGGDTPSRAVVGKIVIRENSGWLTGVNLSSDVNTPDLCSINVIFDIPK